MLNFFDTTKYLGEKDWIFIIFPNLTIYSWPPLTTIHNILFTHFHKSAKIERGMLLLSLSIDGKILMESYGSFLGFVRRSLCEVFKKYKLITAIRVWIDG